MLGNAKIVVSFNFDINTLKRPQLWFVNIRGTAIRKAFAECTADNTGWWLDVK